MNESKSSKGQTPDTNSLTASIVQALAALSDRAQANEGQVASEVKRAREALAELEHAATAQQDLIADALRDLRAQEVKLAERIQERLADSAGAVQKVSALERSLEEARESVETAEAKALERAQQASESQQAAEAAQQRCAELQRQVDDLQATVQTLEEKLEEAESSTEALRQAVDAKEEEDVAAAEQVRQLEEQLTERTAALEAAESSVLALRQAVDAKEEEDVAAAEQVRQLEEELAALKGAEESRSGDSEAVKAELEGLRTEVKTLQLELNENQGAAAEADALREELARERQRTAALEGRLEDELARGKESALAAQLSEALRAREEAEDRLAALQRETEISATSDGPELKRVAAGMRVPDLSAAAEIVEDLELGVASEPEEPPRGVLDVAGSDRDGRKRHIGQILLDAGTITRAQLDESLDIQRSSPNRHLGEILIDQGFVSDEVVAQALSRQSGIEYVRIASGDIDRELLGMLGKKLAALHRCIPLRSDGSTLTLAMENPLDLIAIEDVERATQLSVAPVASPRGEILLAIQDYYGDA